MAGPWVPRRGRERRPERLQLLSTLGLSRVREIFLLLNSSLTFVLFLPTIQKKEKNIHCVGGRCLRFKAVGPAREMIPKGAGCWEGSLSGRSFFPLPSSLFNGKVWVHLQNLVHRQQATWGQLLGRRRWPQARYKALTHPGPICVFILHAPHSHPPLRASASATI